MAQCGKDQKCPVVSRLLFVWAVLFDNPCCAGRRRRAVKRVCVVVGL